MYRPKYEKRMPMQLYYYPQEDRAQNGRPGVSLHVRQCQGCVWCSALLYTSRDDVLSPHAGILWSTRSSGGEARNPVRLHRQHDGNAHHHATPYHPSQCRCGSTSASIYTDIAADSCCVVASSHALAG
jgi:hypothetical protein